MRIIAKVNASNEYHDHDRFAVIDVDVAFVREVFEHLRIAGPLWKKGQGEALGDFVELVFYDGRPEFVDDLDDDELAERLENGGDGYVVFGDDYDTEFPEGNPVVAVLLHLRNDGFYWTGYPKRRDDTTLETVTFPYEVLSPTPELRELIPMRSLPASPAAPEAK